MRYGDIEYEYYVLVQRSLFDHFGTRREGERVSAIPCSGRSTVTIMTVATSTLIYMNKSSAISEKADRYVCLLLADRRHPYIL